MLPKRLVIIQQCTGVHRLQKRVQTRQTRLQIMHVVLGKHGRVDLALVQRVLEQTQHRLLQRRESRCSRMCGHGRCCKELNSPRGTLQEHGMDVPHKMRTHIVP